MKDEEKKSLTYHNFTLSDISGDAKKILAELDNYLRILQERLAVAEMNAIDAKNRRAKESAEYISRIEFINQKFKEEKASWSSKERSYESKIKTLADENDKLKRRLSRVSPTIYYVGNEEGKISAEKAFIDRSKNAAQDLLKEVKNLRKNIEDNYIEAQHLEESIKDYTDEKGYDEAYEIFERLNTLLAGVDAWTAAFKRLKKFFKEKKKDIDKSKSPRNINLTGDHPTYNENNND